MNEKVLTPLTVGSKNASTLTLNSKDVTSDALFVAIPGFQQDGAVYIKEALEKGASTIVISDEAKNIRLPDYMSLYPDVSFYSSPNVRKAVSRLAASLCPRQPEQIVAVTGTNGKTSTAAFIRQLWHHQGKVAASLGNLGLVIEGGSLPDAQRTDTLNTPDAVKLHQILQHLSQAHINHLAFEASSHGLHQYRLDGVKLKAAVFTNLTNDHLDYHHTMDAYFEAKCRLFSELLPQGCPAILNADIPEFKALEKICQARGIPILSFGKNPGSIQLFSRKLREDSQGVSLLIDGKSYDFVIPLVGEFQAYNVMAALGALIGLGEDIDKSIEACQKLSEVPGRLQQAAPGVYVDFAHTPDALSMALQALRPHAQKNLWVIFGCGGDRDAIKRPIMGEIAARYADKVIVTDDNPRYENPADIRREIVSACPSALEISPRQDAIAFAMEQRGPGDILLIAGKGHETVQLIQGQELPFSDVEIVKECA